MINFDNVVSSLFQERLERQNEMKSKVYSVDEVIDQVKGLDDVKSGDKKSL